jgi:hypothetical protein
MFEALILIASLNQMPVNKENCEREFGKQASPMYQSWTPKNFYVGCHLLLKQDKQIVRNNIVRKTSLVDTSWTSSITPIK